MTIQQSTNDQPFFQNESTIEPKSDNMGTLDQVSSKYGVPTNLHLGPSYQYSDRGVSGRKFEEPTDRYGFRISDIPKFDD